MDNPSGSYGGNSKSISTPSKNTMQLYGEIPGSKPDWQGANIKGKGKIAPGHIPTSLLGSGGFPGWAAAFEGQQGWGRKHYHESYLTQTTAKGSLPCVDPLKASNGNIGPAAANTVRQQRRHRQQPPANHRPQGRKMIPQPEPEAVLALQQPDNPSCSTGSPKAGGSTRSPQPTPYRLPHSAPAQPQQQQQQHGAQEIPATQTTAATAASAADPSSHRQDQQSQFSSSTSSALLPNTDHIYLTGDLNSSRTGVKPRVENDPNYFRTEKDPPTLQRFCASLKTAAQKDGPSTAARHTLGIEAKQQAVTEQARREVAALKHSGDNDW